MCGRTACSLDKDTICQRCTLRRANSKQLISPKWLNDPSGHTYKPSYNRAPGSYDPILFLKPGNDQGLQTTIIQPMLWGLVPSFMKDNATKSYSMSNARIESLMTKPTYGGCMRHGWRCVVVVQGFYEWKTINGKKQPYFIYIDNPEKMLMMAGVYSYNHTRQLYSYSVVTAAAKGSVAELHHRMPVILCTDDEVLTWLDTESVSAERAYEFLIQVSKNLESTPLRMHKVTPKMNSTKYNEADCVMDIEKPKNLKRESLENNSELPIAFMKRPKADGENEPETSCKKSINNKITSAEYETKPNEEFKSISKLEEP